MSSGKFASKLGPLVRQVLVEFPVPLRICECVVSVLGLCWKPFLSGTEMVRELLQTLRSDRPALRSLQHRSPMLVEQHPIATRVIAPELRPIVSTGVLDPFNNVSSIRHASVTVASPLRLVHVWKYVRAYPVAGASRFELVLEVELLIRLRAHPQRDGRKLPTIVYELEVEVYVGCWLHIYFTYTRFSRLVKSRLPPTRLGWYDEPMAISDPPKTALGKLRVVLDDHGARILHPQGGEHTKANVFDARLYIPSRHFEDIFFDRAISPQTIDDAPKGGLNTQAVDALAAIRAVLVSEKITLRNDQGVVDVKVPNRFEPRLDLVANAAEFTKELFDEGGLTVDKLTEREAS